MEPTVGVVSDTHGLLRPSVQDRLRSCDLIVHAGDIGNEAVLEQLQGMGKVVAVRGNVDRGAWADQLRTWEMVEFHGKTILVIHNIADLDWDPTSSKVDVVVYGHSHRASTYYANNVLYLNPGSTGPRRFTLPITMAYIRLTDRKIVPELIYIDEK